MTSEERIALKLEERKMLDEQKGEKNVK